MASPPIPHRTNAAALAVAGLLLLLAVLVLRDAAALTIAATYGIGPKARPFMIGAILIALGLGHLALAFRGGLPPPEAETDPGAVLWLAGGLIGLMACIGLGTGFIPATAILFAATARAFGRRALLMDLVIGAGLGLAVYLLFSKLLALGLPEGPLERLI